MQNNTQDPQAYYRDPITEAEAKDATEQASNSESLEAAVEKTEAPVVDVKEDVTPTDIDDVVASIPAIEEPAVAEPETPAPIAAEPEVSVPAITTPTKPHRSARLEEYIRTTRELLDFTRKERNSLIIRIDEEEDKITHERHDYTTGLQKYNAINQMRDELNSKNNLIRALIELIRSVD